VGSGKEERKKNDATRDAARNGRGEHRGERGGRAERRGSAVAREQEDQPALSDTM
jgi:hypothetical protein